MPLRILLVDDHHLVRDGLRRVLECFSDLLLVGESSDGLDAVNMARDVRPDLVLMDITLDGLDGVEATRRIRAAQPTTKVLGLSMHTGSRTVASMLEAGATGYLSKFCRADELARAIRVVGRGGRYLGEQILPALLDIRPVRDAGTKGEDPPSLTPRQRGVLRLLAAGRTTKEIAEELDIGIRTVETHRRNISRRFDVHGLAELVKLAIRERLVSAGPNERPPARDYSAAPPPPLPPAER